MMRSAWLRAARLQLHTIGFVPLLLGSIAAWYELGRFSWTRLILSVLIGLLIHLVTALVNDVADVGTDERNPFRSLFSGGSGVIVEGRLSCADLVKAASVAVFLAIVLTAALVFLLHVHWGIFLFLGWGLLSSIGYSLSPLKISYRGGGEFMVLVTYSVALVWTGFFVQAGPIHAPLPWFLSIPIGFAVFSLITVTQFPDKDADWKAGKRSLVILLGERITLGTIAATILLSLVSVLIFLWTGLVPVWAGILSLLCFPLAVALVRIVFHDDRGMTMYAKLSQGTLMLTLWLGLAPALGLFLDQWLR